MSRVRFSVQLLESSHQYRFQKKRVFPETKIRVEKFSNLQESNDLQLPSRDVRL